MSYASKIGVQALHGLGYAMPEATSMVRIAQGGNVRMQRQLDRLAGEYHGGGGGGGRGAPPRGPAGPGLSGPAPSTRMITDKSGSPASNKWMGVMGMLGMAGLGAMAGGATAYASDGNMTPGTLWGALIGGVAGVASSRGLSQAISKKAGGFVSPGAVNKTAAVGAGMGAGYAFSGNRGDDKRRGFNAKRGNKISSSRY